MCCLHRRRRSARHASGARTMQLNGVEMAIRPNLGLYTQPVSCIGLPVVAVPAARAREMPIGVQIIAAPWREDHALRVAAALETLGFTAPAPSGCND